MIAKWMVYRDETSVRHGRAPLEGYTMSEKEKELLTSLLNMRQRLILLDEYGAGLQTSVSLLYFIKLLIR